MEYRQARCPQCGKAYVGVGYTGPEEDPEAVLLHEDPEDDGCSVSVEWDRVLLANLRQIAGFNWAMAGSNCTPAATGALPEVLDLFWDTPLGWTPEGVVDVDGELVQDSRSAAWLPMEMRSPSGEVGQ